MDVRPATPEDCERLGPVWEDLRARYDPAPAPGAVALVDRMRARAEDGAGRFRLLVAWDGATPVGIAAVAVSDDSLWSASPSAVVSLLHVVTAHRRRGVARQLLAAAVGVAEERGAPTLAVELPPQARDVHRFYARLGFAPVVTRRSAAVGALRRRLVPDAAAGRLLDLRARASVRRRLLQAATLRSDAPRA
ncbi:MAG: GNAT family N-acetyltransferase [Actinomycetota bacterium]|nr:MAG: GNAT family N-acetyltransferase [Actinomycetota bacterium]